MNFQEFNLDSRLYDGINRAGFQRPAPVQQAAIPSALAGNDLICTAQKGTGNTAAFVHPILDRLARETARHTRALIVTPTRELAEQIDEAIRILARGTAIRSISVYRGVASTPQIDALRRGVDIVVACPGRPLDFIMRIQAHLDKAEWLVLDEADRLLDMGFLPEVRRILT